MHVRELTAKLSSSWSCLPLKLWTLLTVASLAFITACKTTKPGSSPTSAPAASTPAASAAKDSNASQTKSKKKKPKGKNKKMEATTPHTSD